MFSGQRSGFISLQRGRGVLTGCLPLGYTPQNAHQGVEAAGDRVRTCLQPSCSDCYQRERELLEHFSTDERNTLTSVHAVLYGSVPNTSMFELHF